MVGRIVWRIGPIKFNPDFKISSFGRLMSPSGEITRGFFYDNLRWAAVDEGLVCLTMAAKLIPHVKHIAPRYKMAYDCLASGFGPDELSQVAGIEMGTAWSYFCIAATYLNRDDRLKLGSRVVEVDLWSTLLGMKNNKVAVFGDSLQNTMRFLPRMGACPFLRPKPTMRDHLNHASATFELPVSASLPSSARRCRGPSS